MLNVSQVSLGYNGKPVLHFAGMQLLQGEHCLLNGPSGSGKTTLLYAIAGLVRTLEGTITLAGTNISAISEAARDHLRGRQIGMIFQTLHLVRSLNVLDNLLLASYVAGMSRGKERSLELLDRLGIADKAAALPEELSQGQAQRVAIARAVLHRPALILADEPTSSLDDAVCADVVELIRQTARESGATLLISTHDSRVKNHFDRVVSLGGAL